MRSPLSRHLLSPAIVSLLALAPAAACAQSAGHDHGHETQETSARADSTAAVHAADQEMSAPHPGAGAHLRLTPVRPATAADSTRAGALLATVRAAIAKYGDVDVAEAEGYRMFAPGLRNQRVLHFTHGGRAVREHFRFDATQPTSLLYRRSETGQLELLGAMYVAPKRATLEELDARVPLSIARWHAHVDICVPPPRQRERWAEREGDRLRFGPAGAITTEAQCDAAGGRFHEQLFGWMVHVNAFAEDGQVWGDHHAGH
jgi:hypothetical protein